jgi:hypothetical protein
MGVKSSIDNNSSDHFKFRLNGSYREVKAFPGGTVRCVFDPVLVLLPLRGIHHNPAAERR